MKAAALIGRGDELRCLQSAAIAAVTGQGALITLCGDAGIGKSRLIEELARGAKAEDMPAVWARCSASEVSTPYMPIIDAVRSLLNTIPAQSVEHLLSPSRARLARLLPELQRHDEELQANDRESDPSASDQFQFIDNLCMVFVEASKTRPLLLVIEDAQWSDGPSLRLLLHLTRFLRNSRILCIVTYRPAEIHLNRYIINFLREIQREPVHQKLSLGNLSGYYVGQLVDELIDGNGAIDDQVIGLVATESEGNPLFIEELVSHLVDNGSMVLRDGAWRLDYGIRPRRWLPENIRTIIAARVGELSQRCRTILGCASILGNEFDFSVLCAMGDDDGETVLACLEEAVSAQIIAELPWRVVPAYSFRHGFLQQMLYEELSLPRRQRLHAKAATAIEAAHHSSLDRHVAALSRHYALAGIAGDPEKAVQYCMRAAEAAEGVFAYEEAVEHLETALEFLQEIGADPRRRADLLYRLSGYGGVSRSGERSACRYARRAVDLYTQIGDSTRTAQARSRLGWCLSTDLGELDVHRALKEFAVAEPALREHATSSSLSQLYTGWSVAYFWALDPRRGEEAAVKAMRINGIVENARIQNHAAAMKGWHAFVAGRIDEGTTTMSEAWMAADAGDLAGSAFRAALNRGLAAILLVDYADALVWLQRELRATRQLQASSQAESLRLALAWVAAEAGEAGAVAGGMRRGGARSAADNVFAVWQHDPNRTLRIWSEQWSQSLTVGNRWFMWLLTLQIGRLLRLLHNFDDSIDWLTRGITLLSLDGGAVPELHLRLELGLTLAAAGRTPDARSELERCRELMSEEAEWRGLSGRLTLLAAALTAADDRADPDRGFRAAVGTFRRYRAVRDEAEALEFWAGALHRRGDARAATQLLDGATAIYRRHGAVEFWVQRMAGLQQCGASAVDRPVESLDGLTPREIDVLRLLAHGQSNRQIASTLVISENTVARHVSAILRKCDCSNRAEAAIHAVKQGLLR